MAKNPPYPKGKAKAEKVFKEYKKGELNIGKSSKKVTKKSQAVAIALSEQRKAEKKNKK